MTVAQVPRLSILTVIGISLAVPPNDAGGVVRPWLVERRG